DFCLLAGSGRARRTEERQSGRVWYDDRSVRKRLRSPGHQVIECTGLKFAETAGQFALCGVLGLIGTRFCELDRGELEAAKLSARPLGQELRVLLLRHSALRGFLEVLQPDLLHQI